MVKSSFSQTYDRTIKFYDFQYHLHKAAYKGLSSVMKDYSDCQKNYADKLIDIGKNISSYIPDLNTQMTAIKNSMNDFVQCISNFSQLHFNYSERLNEISHTLSAEYAASKKLKQKHMKVLKDQFSDNLQKIKQSKIRPKIVEQEAHICKMLYKHLDTYAQQQFTRTQKVKQQLLIYFAMAKKIQQKQLEMTTKYKSKISQQQVEISLTQLDKINECLVNQYNSYLESGQVNQAERLSIKRYGRMQSVQINAINMRQSLKQSGILRDRMSKINVFQTKLKDSLDAYEKLPEKLFEVNMALKQHPKPNGLFDYHILRQTRKYSNILQTQVIKRLSFDMINSYYAKNKDSQIKLILNTIKGNLKITQQSLNQKSKNIQDFFTIQLAKLSEMQIDSHKMRRNKQYQFHIHVFQIINQIYYQHEQQFRDQSHVNEQTLISYLKNNEIGRIKFKHKNQLNLTVSSVLIKHLLSSLIIINQDQPLLIDDFPYYLKYVCQFSQQFLKVNQNIVKLLFLQLFENAIRSTKNTYVQEIYNLIDSQPLKSNRKKSDVIQKNIQFQQTLIAYIVRNVTQGIVNFYELGIPLINFFSILSCIENFSTQKFSAVQYFHKCIKRAGYRYIFWIDEQKKIIQPSIWQGQMRLKNLVQILQKLQFDKLQQNHFKPTCLTMAHILGVNQNVILKKFKQQILQALSKVIEQNMDLLVHQQGIDKQGYILKLGVFLTQLDIPGFTREQFKIKYFQVLQLYLTNTQKQYNNLLDHSRKTQLWIMQQNTLATQNCIDFCSLLYKPFQFLLSTLKILNQQSSTQFTKQFSQFIKNKLNNILKQQIFKYINFLQDSLRTFNSQQQQIYYKPKRGQTISQFTTQQTTKMTFQFKQVVRRLYNLNFLKSQLDEIICDFLDEQIYQDLGSSIFNLQNLNRATGKYKQYKQILTNLKDIVQTITSVEQKLIYKVSDITVFHFMKKIFFNIYFQQQKSAFQQFFSTKNDYKLSQYTFVKYQKQLEEVFSMIRKYIPEQIPEKYYVRLISSFFKGLKYQILNSTKMKLPKSKEDIVRYLDEDTTFMCTMLKQKYISPQIIQQELQRPLKRLLNSLSAQTKDLMQRFQTQSLKNNNQQCRYILILLYLRSNDQKAQQFFKKYKTIVFK